MGIMLCPYCCTDLIDNFGGFAVWVSKVLKAVARYTCTCRASYAYLFQCSVDGERRWEEGPKFSANTIQFPEFKGIDRVGFRSQDFGNQIAVQWQWHKSELNLDTFDASKVLLILFTRWMAPRVRYSVTKCSLCNIPCTHLGTRWIKDWRQ